MATTAVVAVPADAAVTPAVPTVSRTVLAAAPDLATTLYGDPWDYDNAEDQLTDGEGPWLNGDGVSFIDGRLRIRASVVRFVFNGISGGLPEGREPDVVPIDAGDWSDILLRADATAQRAGGLVGFGTPGFQWLPGDRTYRLDAPGTGPVQDAYYNSAAGGDWWVDVDELRIVDLDGSDPEPRTTTITFGDPEPGGAAATLFAVDRYGDELLLATTTAAEDAVTVDTGLWWPGAHQLLVEHDGVRSPAATIRIETPPAVTILQPDAVGGEDWATAVRGNPWDFDGPDDVRTIANVRDVSYSGGELHATTDGPRNFDSYVHLALDGGSIDTTRYHRLTVRFRYDGPFSLSFDCGGGKHGRFLWWHGGQRFVSREIVTYTDRDTWTFDLSAFGSDLHDPEDYPRPESWDDAPATDLRWDPNEDPCDSTWHLDSIELRADDEPTDGVFDVQWEDASHVDGTTVRWFRDVDASGFDGVAISPAIDQIAGVNTWRWDTVGEPGGTHWLYAEVDDGHNVIRRYSSGPVTFDGLPRVAGSGREATAVALSRRSHPDGADTVLLARAHDYPDALAGVQLAAALDAPLLLTARESLHPDAAAELARLAPDRVVLLGGIGALSDAVRGAVVGALPDATVDRIAGSSRWETAGLLAIAAQEAWTDAPAGTAPTAVLLASGRGFADALAAGPLAGHAQVPLLLTAPDTLPAGTRRALEALDADTVLLVGGPAAVGDAVHQAVEERGLTVERVSGPTRWDTAAALAERTRLAGADEGRVLVTSGTTFPDALAAGPAAVRDGGVLLLTAPNALPPATANLLDTWGRDRLRVAGGRAAIDDDTVEAILARVR